jgi:flagellar basal-body rod protein FlgB
MRFAPHAQSVACNLLKPPAGSYRRGESVMSNILDNVFGLSSQALDVWQRRSEVIASNIANADTPNYQARDVDFRQVLQQASGGDAQTLALSAPTAGQIDATAQSAEALKYRVPLQPSLDGNTVDAQVEQSAFASNMVHYQASLSFINSTIQQLRLAINGGGQG